jgi:hypothetical protein
MKPSDRASLHAAVFRNTAADPAWMGYWLARHQQTENLDEEQLAQKLELPMDNLVLLCLCRSPRDHFQEDLRIVCRRTGASEKVLAQLLRQEQALLARASGSSTGWLMAASDRVEPPPEEGESAHDR